MYADAMICVVEPYYKSLETGRRMAALGVDLGIPRVALVGNKVRDDRERETIEGFAAKNGLEIAAFIPFDTAMPDSERAEAAPLDHAPDAVAIKAIGELAETLMAMGPGNGNGSANGAHAGNAQA